MKNFTTELTNRLNTLATLWNDQKEINLDIKSNKTFLFIDLEKMINEEALIIQEELECFVGLNKIAVDLINDILIKLDDKKEVKQKAILTILLYKFEYNIKFYLGTRTITKGKKTGQEVTAHIGLSTITKLAKLDFLTKKEIKAINANYILNDAKNEDYLTALNTAIKDEEARLLDLDRDIAKLANLNKCTINEDNIEAIIRVLVAKKATYKA